MDLTLQIRNYKSIGETKLNLRSGLNVLVGPNGSGKTCLLSSLKFVRDVFQDGAAQAVARRGGARRVYKHGSNEMTFSLNGSYGIRTFSRRKTRCQFSWKVRLALAGQEKITTIVEEQFKIFVSTGELKKTLFSLTARRSQGRCATVKHYLCKPSMFGRDLFSMWDRIYKGKTKFQISEVYNSDKFQEQFTHVANEPDRPYFPVLARSDDELLKIFNLFKFLNEYNILPDIARSSTEQLPFAMMKSNGAAVGEVIDALENKRFNKLDQNFALTFRDNEDYTYPYTPRRYIQYYRYYSPFNRHGKHRISYNGVWENINKELSAAVKPITSVSVDIDPTNGKRFVIFKSDDDTFSHEEVSDGTVKWLCILVSLFVPYSRVYLLEEPENFLHPWMQQRLISIMREKSELEDTVFFLSSHSATILNVVNPEELLLVSQGMNGTQVSVMEDMKEVKLVLAESDFHLGDLWTSGAIGGVPIDE